MALLLDGALELAIHALGGIPYISFQGQYVYNFWKDAEHERLMEVNARTRKTGWTSG